VHSADCPVTDNRRLDLVQFSQGRPARSHRSEASRQRALRHRPDKGHIEADPSLLIPDYDQTCHDCQAVP
jgi:hypothetical protein